MHAYVENGTVVRTGSLPTAWNLKDGRSVSGFNLWTDAERKPEGWLPVTEQFAALAANQHNGPPAYTVRSDDVLAAYPAVDDPPAQVNAATVNAAIDTSHALLKQATDEAAVPANGPIAAALSTLEAARTAPDLAAGTLTAAQLSNAARARQAESKAVATILPTVLAHVRRIDRDLRRLVTFARHVRRAVLGRYEGTD